MEVNRLSVKENFPAPWGRAGLHALEPIPYDKPTRFHASARIPGGLQSSEHMNCYRNLNSWPAR